jgi:hypothetical protein
LTITERELLRDAAEGYLLMRSPDEGEAAELRGNVAAVLGGLVDSGRWRDETATAVQNAIEACGPASSPSPPDVPDASEPLYHPHTGSRARGIALPHERRT